ncbi:hypothetical protein P7C70_g5390, partial [Phenoliferia sp. Uapishka_3]
MSSPRPETTLTKKKKGKTAEEKADAKQRRKDKAAAYVEEAKRVSQIELQLKDTQKALASAQADLREANAARRKAVNRRRNRNRGEPDSDDDDEESDSDDGGPGVARAHRIERPHGEHGVGGARGFNMQEVMQFDDEDWVEVLDEIRQVMSACHIRVSRKYALVDETAKVAAQALLAKKFPKFDRCVKGWGVRELIKMRIRNHRRYQKTLKAKKARIAAKKARAARV